VLGVGLPHVGELLVPGVLLLVIGMGLIAIAHFWPESAKPVVTSVAPVETIALGQKLELAESPSGPVAVLARSITWPTLVDHDAGDLDEPERRRVLDGLGIVGDTWCAAILARAFDEEDGELRVAAIESLGRCEAEVVGPTLERAYASYVVAERYAAIDGASRRGDLALLERAVRDTDGTVALAAAYGLHRARRDDLIDSNLAGRTDARANEIRRVLTLLT
jgi:hypothetical protein